MSGFNRVWIVLAMSAMLGGCLQDGGLLGYKPRPWGLGGPPADAPEAYKKGWNDGCDTGLSEFAGSYYKSFYKFTQDVKMVDDPVYYQVWKAAEQYCKHYTYKWIYRQDFEGGKGFGPSASTICVICPADAPDKYHGY